ncbi:hypothetical protein QYM36_019492 [Artemia franciscana]|uniref:Reverse transcriptase domain-containing protein n=1 Tax=Artemia franciscana TaxID=6661 RepID=A0AA88KTS8_ARTSF|nr:hypothetical protein QYM36_019492 [Artemia franciscana]
MYTDARSDPNRNGDYHGAFNSHRGSQFSGGRSDLALYSPSQNNYDGRFEGQRGRNSNQSQRQISRGHGQMRGQNIYRGIPAPERRNVRFQENHREAGFMAENYDDPISPFNRFENITNNNEDLSSPLEGCLNLNARFQVPFSSSNPLDVCFVSYIARDQKQKLESQGFPFLHKVKDLLRHLNCYLDMATRTILPNDSSIYFPDEKDIAFFSSENWARGCITLAKKTSIPPRSLVLLDCRARSMGQELPVGAAVLFTPAKEESSLHPYALEYSGNRFLIPYFNNSGDAREISRREALLKAGIIKPGRSLYQSPVFIIAKPVNGVIPERSQLDVKNSRFLIDVRNVNQAIRRSAWPVTRADDIFSTLGLSGARFISIIDVSHGFYNVNLHEKSKKYFSFSFPVTGQQMIFQRLPQGTSPSP